MKVLKRNALILFLALVVSSTSCKNNSIETSSGRNDSEDKPVGRNINREEDNDDSDDKNECKIKDGTHSATVDYTNPETGYSQTYSLDVEVENCEVIQINFPRGGWLDSDHITPAELQTDGTCTIDGEDGKTYEIQIDD